jgi:hypothetical protein
VKNPHMPLPLNARMAYREMHAWVGWVLEKGQMAWIAVADACSHARVLTDSSDYSSWILCSCFKGCSILPYKRILGISCLLRHMDACMNRGSFLSMGTKQAGYFLDFHDRVLMIIPFYIYITKENGNIIFFATVEIMVIGLVKDYAALFCLQYTLTENSWFHVRSIVVYNQNYELSHPYMVVDAVLIPPLFRNIKTRVFDSSTRLFMHAKDFQHCCYLSTGIH